jgi:hypothetical protein
MRTTTVVFVDMDRLGLQSTSIQPNRHIPCAPYPVPRHFQNLTFNRPPRFAPIAVLRVALPPCVDKRISTLSEYHELRESTGFQIFARSYAPKRFSEIVSPASVGGPLVSVEELASGVERTGRSNWTEP